MIARTRSCKACVRRLASTSSTTTRHVNTQSKQKALKQEQLGQVANDSQSGTVTRQSTLQGAKDALEELAYVQTRFHGRVESGRIPRSRIASRDDRAGQSVKHEGMSEIPRAKGGGSKAIEGGSARIKASSKGVALSATATGKSKTNATRSERRESASVQAPTLGAPRASALGKSQASGIKATSSSSSLASSCATSISSAPALSSTASSIPEEIYPYALSLPPPPSAIPQLASPSISHLRTALQRTHLSKTLKHFSRLHSLNALPLLLPSDYALISRFLLQILPTLSLGAFKRDWPEDYGLLREMALFAAVRGETEGGGEALNELCEALLKAGDPLGVISTFNDFKDRLRVHQGKDLSALHSRIREERVAARLDHAYLIPLMTSHIAAHTMLNTFTGTEMLALLDTNANFRSPHAFPLFSLRRIYGFHPRGPLKGIMERIKENCARLCLAVLCYHPAALVNRTFGLVDARDWFAVEGLYEEVLSASIGKRRWLVPLDLETREDARFDCIPLTTRVWATFMIAFRTSGRLDLIDQMLDVDMPARALKPSAWNVSLAMVSFAIAGNRDSNASYLLRADQLWDRILQQGHTAFDIAIARRMDVLEIMRREHDWRELYRACLNGHLSGGGRYTASAYLKLLLQRGKRIEALKVLKDMLEGGPTALCRPDSFTYYTILRHVVRGPYTSEEKLETVTALHEFSAEFEPGAWAIILSLALENGQDVEAATRGIIDLMHRGARMEHGMLTIMGWDHFFSALLRGSAGYPTASELRAALASLHEFARRGATAKTHKTLLNLHQLVLVNIARSNDLDSDERHHALVSAMALLKRQEPLPHRRIYAAILRVCLDRQDDDGYEEALYWWAVLKEYSQVADSAWTTMLQGLLAADRFGAARALVEDARKTVGKAGADSKRFWDLAVAVEQRKEMRVGYAEVLEDVQDEELASLDWQGFERDEMVEELEALEDEDEDAI